MVNKALSLNEIPLNEVKPFIVANVKLQCKRDVTSRISIVGSPGCGKSDLIRQICQENGWGLAVKYLSNMSLEQITGIPCKVEDGDHARFTKPEIFNFDELDYKPENFVLGQTTTILLIDDFHLADKIIQKYLFQLLTYKSINSYKLPANCAIVLAGNKMTDKALAHTIPAPVMNRIAVYEVKADKDDWLKNYAFTHDVRSDITSFISAKGDAYFIQTPIESTPWASPRSWTFLSEQMDEYEEEFGTMPIDKLKLIANSLIGEEFTSEFIAYREIYSRWDIGKLVGKSDDELLKKFKQEIEKNPVAGYAIINAALTWMIDNAKKLDFNISDQSLQKAIKFTYNIMTQLLKVDVRGVQIKPLVIAGTSYIYMYYGAIQSTKMAAKFEKVLDFFLEQMKQKRDVDWLYYEIIAYVFDYQVSADDKKQIEKAKESLQNK